eukprot:scaffold8048_cov93-Cyclotella_meneghiniana.AAC.1
MPTNVHVQIQHAASPESYTDRATSSTTATSNTISSNNRDQSTITTAEINAHNKGDQTVNDTAYSTPTRPPPGIPSISTHLTEQLPPQRPTNSSTTSYAQQQSHSPTPPTVNNTTTPMDTSDLPTQNTTNNNNTIDSTFLNQLMNHITSLTAQVQDMNKKFADTTTNTKLNTTPNQQDNPTPGTTMKAQPTEQNTQPKPPKQPQSVLDNLHIQPMKQSYAQKLQQSANTHRTNVFDHISPNSVATDIHSFTNRNDYSVPHRPIHNSPVPVFSLRWHSTIKTLKTNRYFDAHFSSELPATSFVNHFNSIYNDPLTEIYLVHHEDCPTRTSNGDVKLSGYIDVAL